MPRNIKPQHGILARQALFFAPGLRFVEFKGDGRGSRSSGHEQSVLPRLAHPRGSLQCGEGIVHGSEQRLARPEGIERSGLDKALENAFVQKARFDAFAEIIKRLELALRQARFANGLGGVFTNVLDSGKAKTNGFAHRREI